MSETDLPLREDKSGGDGNKLYTKIRRLWTRPASEQFSESRARDGTPLAKPSVEGHIVAEYVPYFFQVCSAITSQILSQWCSPAVTLISPLANLPTSCANSAPDQNLIQVFHQLLKTLTSDPSVSIARPDVRRLVHIQQSVMSGTELCLPSTVSTHQSQTTL